MTPGFASDRLSVGRTSLYAGFMPQAFSFAEDDATLARRIAAIAPERDAAAEAEICRRFAPRVRLFGLRHLRNAAVAADLAQEVLIIVLQKLRGGGLNDVERLAAFVLGTARQCVVDWRRNTTRRERILAAFPVDFPSLVEEDTQHLDAGRLRGCLQKLPERERAVLMMSFYDDRSAQVVGTELGLSVANVRVIRHRGIQHLRECMNIERELP
jgi:RNA polymerase sigma-70 factor (ECF subfamily)